MVIQAVVVAIGVRETGETCVLGVAVGASETEAFWVEFCRQLVARRLQRGAAGDLRRPRGPQGRPGSVLRRRQLAAVHHAFPAQRGGRLLTQDAPAVLALGKTVFAQPTQQAAKAAVDQVLERLEPTVPQAAATLRHRGSAAKRG